MSVVSANMKVNATKYTSAQTTPVELRPDSKDVVYIGESKGDAKQTVVFEVKTLCKTVMINGCERVAVIVQDVRATIEIVACKQIQVQVVGSAPTIQLDNCSRSNIFLSDAAAGECLIVSSKIDACNVSFDKAGDQVEVAIPEQISSKVTNGKLVSRVKGVEDVN